jgi:hypothetical protein
MISKGDPGTIFVTFVRAFGTYAAASGIPEKEEEFGIPLPGALSILTQSFSSPETGSLPGAKTLTKMTKLGSWALLRNR